MARNEDLISRGSAVGLAYDRAVRPLLENHRSNLYRTLIAHYRDGEHGTKLLAVLGELAGLENLEAICVQSIKQGAAAEAAIIKEARNVSTGEGERRNY